MKLYIEKDIKIIFLNIPVNEESVMEQSKNFPLKITRGKSGTSCIHGNEKVIKGRKEGQIEESLMRMKSECGTSRITVDT